MVEILRNTLAFLPKHLSNKDVYESEDIVKSYSNILSLQKPEETILNVLRDKLQDMKMLDIGVGAGRTTRYFAPLTKEYLGVDYSESMIEICRQRYPKSAKLSFEIADARAMKSIRDRHFDVVLFSFNGIDMMNHEDRLAVLREVHRVTRKRGYFCFSTHNLNSALNLCTFRVSTNPLNLFKETGRLVLMRLVNKNSWKALRQIPKKQQFMIFKNGAHNFRTTTYYITAKEQIRQLTDSGFSKIKTYGLYDGKEIRNSSDLQNSMDEWLYYLCTNN